MSCRFENEFDLSLYRTSAIDPLRAKAACSSIARGFGKTIEVTITTVHKENPVTFPWKDLEEVPDCNLFNMDEVGENGEYKRSKKLCSAVLNKNSWMRVLEPIKGERPDAIKRMFEVTLGDNGDGLKHRTLCITTCGNGMFSEVVPDGSGGFARTPGACAPMLMHATSPSTTTKKTAVSQAVVAPVTSKMTENIYAIGATEPMPGGIKVSPGYIQLSVYCITILFYQI